MKPLPSSSMPLTGISFGFVQMFETRSGWVKSMPLSITPTTTSEEPVVRSQASGASISAFVPFVVIEAVLIREEGVVGIKGVAPDLDIGRDVAVSRHTLELRRKLLLRHIGRCLDRDHARQTEGPLDLDVAYAGSAQPILKSRDLEIRISIDTVKPSDPAAWYDLGLPPGLRHRPDAAGRRAGETQQRGALPGIPSTAGCHGRNAT